VYTDNKHWSSSGIVDYIQSKFPGDERDDLVILVGSAVDWAIKTCSDVVRRVRKRRQMHDAFDSRLSFADEIQRAIGSKQPID
jgi:hypothetical protein